MIFTYNTNKTGDNHIFGILDEEHQSHLSKLNLFIDFDADIVKLTTTEKFDNTVPCVSFEIDSEGILTREEQHTIVL